MGSYEGLKKHINLVVVTRNPYKGYPCPYYLVLTLSIVEFKTRVGTQKRIRIPTRVDVEVGEEVLVKIERIKPKKGSATT